MPVTPGSVLVITPSLLGGAISLNICWDCNFLSLNSYGFILLFVTVVSSSTLTNLSLNKFDLLVANLTVVVLPWILSIK